NEFMINSTTGYVGLVGGFQHTSDDELREAISDLKKQGMRQLVLDLRNNPGGLLDQAIDVASEFLAVDNVVVWCRGLNGYNASADPTRAACAERERRAAKHQCARVSHRGRESFLRRWRHHSGY